MMLSAFFDALNSSYRSELEDLAFDSEGHDVLAQRLADKRREIGFLVGMMELSPEMVAVVFHRAFTFRLPAAMDDLLGRESDEFPEWHSLSDAVTLAPWAQGLAERVLEEPRGEWFMTVAAGLEFMSGKPAAAGAGRDDDDEDEDGDEDDGFDDEGNAQPLDADDLQGDARERREAADDWMVDQGFDKKD